MSQRRHTTRILNFLRFEVFHEEIDWSDATTFGRLIKTLEKPNFSGENVKGQLKLLMSAIKITKLSILGGQARK